MPVPPVAPVQPQTFRSVEGVTVRNTLTQLYWDVNFLIEECESFRHAASTDQFAQKCSALGLGSLLAGPPSNSDVGLSAADSATSFPSDGATESGELAKEAQRLKPKVEWAEAKTEILEFVVPASAEEHVIQTVMPERRRSRACDRFSPNHRVPHRIDSVLRDVDSVGSDKPLHPLYNHDMKTFLGRLYRDKCLQHTVVDSIMAVIIVLNMVYVGVASEVSASETFFGLDIFFASCFCLERIFKLHTLGLRDYFIGREWKWNTFETILVVVGVVEVCVSADGASSGELSSPLVRMIRLVRIAKIIRVWRLQVFEELMVMVNGVIGGMRTLCWAFVLISIPLYIVAMILRETAGRTNNESDIVSENFANVAMSFFTMFRCVVADDCSDHGGRPIFLLLSRSQGWGFAAIYIVTILLMNFGLFNVIVAIFVENTLAAAKHNEISIRRQRLQDDEIFEEKTRDLLDLVESLRKAREPEGSTSTHISMSLFDELCEHSTFRDILAELDVAEEDQFDLFDTLDVDGGGTLDTAELVTGISMLRGDPRRADIVSIGLTVRSLQGMFQSFQDVVFTAFAEHQTSLTAIQETLAGNHTSSLAQQASRGVSALRNLCEVPQLSERNVTN
eukprot:TRINITY_DN4248_c0_g1_i4.p1 TRINITY_DN4248_c0_g1~~TRINITY_DN4248_c0_g1_i4.p1  ORF type:complete len:645 (-),score=100.21 TRINITY_DN4248_c0_g1_i4:36-1895(-)